MNRVFSQLIAIFVAVVALFSLAGCNAKIPIDSMGKSVLPLQGESPQSGYAYIYVFRGEGKVNSYHVQVSLGARVWGKIAPDSFIVAKVPAGSYILKHKVLDIPFYDYGNQISIYLESGKSYYYLYTDNPHKGLFTDPDEFFTFIPIGEFEASGMVKTYTLSAFNDLANCASPHPLDH